jgi:Ca-activated chloride channel homolog
MGKLLDGTGATPAEAQPDRRPGDCSTSAVGARWRASVAAVAVLAAVVGLGAGAVPQFAATTEVVEVYATVTDANGQPVSGLPAGAFTVLEEGVPQPVTVFTTGEAALTVAVTLDRSFSMTAGGLDTARAGAGRLVDQLRPSDRVLLLAIGGGVERLAGFDEPRASARRALDRVTLWGSSPIGDVVAHALEAVSGERGRRAVVVWSDGVEREAQQSREAVLERVRRSDALIYSVATAATTSPLLAQLAAVSGGRVFQARTRDAAREAADAIALELRHQYVLGYAPPSGAPGWRALEVRVNRPGLRVRARQGYVVPAGPAGASP